MYLIPFCGQNSESSSDKSSGIFAFLHKGMDEDQLPPPPLSQNIPTKDFQTATVTTMREVYCILGYFLSLYTRLANAS